MDATYRNALLVAINICNDNIKYIVKQEGRKFNLLSHTLMHRTGHFADLEVDEYTWNYKYFPPATIGDKFNG